MSRAVQVKAGNRNLGGSKISFDPHSPYPALARPNCSLSCAPSHICCCQLGPHSACHPHILPLASFLQKAEGRLHAASLPSFKTSSTIWEACCRAGGMRRLASQRAKDACRAGGAQPQREWDSGSFGSGPLSREEPCWARESRRDEAESAWVKVATLGSWRLKGDCSAFREKTQTSTRIHGFRPSHPTPNA